MTNYFYIDGYFKDDKTEFNNYIVKETDDYTEDEDDDIFFFGLSEKEIKDYIEIGEETSLDFVITDYRKLS